MSLASRVSEASELLDAFSEDLFDLAYLHQSEPTKQSLEMLRELKFPLNMAVSLQSECAKEAVYAISRGLENLPKDISQDVLDVMAADFADIYLNYTFGASPCESVWIDEDNLALQEPTFQVRAFYRQFAVKAANWRLRADDHLVSELEFVATLLGSKSANKTIDALSSFERAEAAARFLDEHLLRWIPLFSKKVEKRAATQLFAGLAALTAAYLEELRVYLEGYLNVPRPTKEEIDRRMRPGPLVTIGSSKFVPGVSPSW